MILDKEDFVNEALDRGFTEFSFGLFRKDSSSSTTSLTFTIEEGGKVVVHASQTAPDCTSSRRFIFGNLNAAFKKLVDLDSELFIGDNREMAGQDNIKAARMIHELRTLTLGNDDKLLVLAKDHLDQVDMESLAACLSRWVGDKGLHKVLVVKGVEMVKIQGENTNGK